MKPHSKDRDSPLPEGWLEAMFQRVDLERSYAALRGLKHFHVEAWRGRIRTEQLRFESAWKHYDKAYELSEKVEENIPNLVRQFILNIWCFENALLEAPLSDGMADTVPEAWVPDLPEVILNEFPDVRLVIQMRRRSEALLRLHLGDYNEAAEIYETLIEESRQDTEGALPFHYLGLAACEHNLGFADRAKRNLENAGLALASAVHLWNQARAASVLCAFHKYLENAEETANWEAFIDRLNCPEVTKQLTRKRAEIIMARCQEKSNLVLMFG